MKSGPSQKLLRKQEQLKQQQQQQQQLQQQKNLTIANALIEAVKNEMTPLFWEKYPSVFNDAVQFIVLFATLTKQLALSRPSEELLNKPKSEMWQFECEHKWETLNVLNFLYQQIQSLPKSKVANKWDEIQQVILHNLFANAVVAFDKTTKLYTAMCVSIGKNQIYSNKLDKLIELIQEISPAYKKLLDEVVSKVNSKKPLNHLEIVKGSIWDGYYELFALNINYAVIKKSHEHNYNFNSIAKDREKYTQFKQQSSKYEKLSNKDHTVALETMATLDVILDDYDNPPEFVNFNPAFKAIYEQCLSFETDIKKMLKEFSQNVSNETALEKEPYEALIQALEFAEKSIVHFNFELSEAYFNQFDIMFKETTAAILKINQAMSFAQATNLLSKAANIGKQWQKHFEFEHSVALHRWVPEKWQDIAGTFEKAICEIQYLDVTASLPKISLLDEVSLRTEQDVFAKKLFDIALSATSSLETEKQVSQFLCQYNAQLQNKNFAVEVVTTYKRLIEDHNLTFSAISQLIDDKTELSLAELQHTFACKNIHAVILYQFMEPMNLTSLDETRVKLLHTLFKSINKIAQVVYQAFIASKYPIGNNSYYYAQLLELQKLQAKFLPEYDLLTTKVLNKKDINISYELKEKLIFELWSYNYFKYFSEYYETYLKAMRSYPKSEVEEDIKALHAALKWLSSEKIAKLSSLSQDKVDSYINEAAKILTDFEAIAFNLIDAHRLYNQALNLLEEAKLQPNIQFSSNGMAFHQFENILKQIQQISSQVKSNTKNNVSKKATESTIKKLISTIELVKCLDSALTYSQALTLLKEFSTLFEDWAECFKGYPQKCTNFLVIEKLQSYAAWCKENHQYIKDNPPKKEPIATKPKVVNSNNNNNNNNNNKTPLVVNQPKSAKEKPVVVEKPQKNEPKSFVPSSSPNIFSKKSKTKKNNHNGATSPSILELEKKPIPVEPKESITWDITPKKEVKVSKEPHMLDYIVVDRSIPVPDEVNDLMLTIEKAGYEIYIVGGYIPDLFLDIKYNDIDFETNCPKELLTSLLPKFKAYPYKDSTFANSTQSYEITCTDNVLKNAKKRDLTISSLYATRKGEICDPNARFKDIYASEFTVNGNVKERIQKNPILIFRFMSQYHKYKNHPKFSKNLSDSIQKGMKKYAYKIPTIIYQRTRKAINTLIFRGNSVDSFKLMHKLEILPYLMTSKEKTADRYRSLLTSEVLDFIYSKLALLDNAQADRDTGFYKFMTLVMLPLVVHKCKSHQFEEYATTLVDDYCEEYKNNIPKDAKSIMKQDTLSNIVCARNSILSLLRGYYYEIRPPKVQPIVIKDDLTEAFENLFIQMPQLVPEEIYYPKGYKGILTQFLNKNKKEQEHAEHLRYLAQVRKMKASKPTFGDHLALTASNETTENNADSNWQKKL